MTFHNQIKNSTLQLTLIMFLMFTPTPTFPHKVLSTTFLKALNSYMGNKWKVVVKVDPSIPTVFKTTTTTPKGVTICHMISLDFE
jgi:hypothetical protein